MFTNAVSIEIADADDGFFIISVTYPDGSTVGFVSAAKEAA